jgi:hypothetical protein
LCEHETPLLDDLADLLYLALPLLSLFELAIVLFTVAIICAFFEFKIFFFFFGNKKFFLNFSKIADYSFLFQYHFFYFGFFFFFFFCDQNILSGNESQEEKKLSFYSCLLKTNRFIKPNSIFSKRNTITCYYELFFFFFLFFLCFIIEK